MDRSELWQRHSYSTPWVGGNGASTWRRGSFFDGLDGVYNVLWSIDALIDIGLVSYDRGTDVSGFSESCRQRGTSTMLDSARSQLYREVQNVEDVHGRPPEQILRGAPPR